MPLLTTARRIVNGCEGNVIHSEYSHANKWSSTSVAVNCYGFLQLLLLECAMIAFDRLNQFMEESRTKIPPSFDGIPCPFHYAAFFNSLDNDPHWESVQGFRNLRPGDILCYLPPDYTPKPISEMPKARTGMHVGVIEKIKVVLDSSLEIDLIDSTRRPHCKEDSRYEKDKGGVGRAPLKISCKEDKPEMPFFLQWGSSQTVWEKKLFFGRLKNLESPHEIFQFLKKLFEKLESSESSSRSIDVVQSCDNLNKKSGTGSMESFSEILESLEKLLEKLESSETPKSSIGIVQSCDRIEQSCDSFEIPLEIFQNLENHLVILERSESDDKPIGIVQSSAQIFAGHSQE